MTLPRDFRFVVYNSTGVSLPVSSTIVTGRRYNFSMSGTVVYENAETNLYTNVASIADATFDVGTPAVSNVSSLWLGGDFLFQKTGSTSGNGALSLFLARSTDGGTTFDTNSEAMLVSAISLINSAVRNVGFGL